MVFDQQVRDALAESARFQIHFRVNAYTGIKPQFDTYNEYLINSKFSKFFLSLELPKQDNLATGLITTDAMLRADFHKLKEYQFSYGSTPECPTLIEFYPRGIVLTSHLEQDKKLKKNLQARIKSEAVRASKRLGKLAHEKLGIIFPTPLGENVFDSEDEYRRLLKRPELYPILNEVISRKVEYLGFVRCDLYIPHTDSTSGNWVKKWSSHHKFPILIIPGLSTSKLENLIELEKKRLKLY
jgi:hypothetical protein